LAERLAGAYVEEALGEDAALIRLHSAGVRAVVGSGMEPRSATVLEQLGGSADDFVARRLEPEMAGSADLVLTMTRDHRRSLLEMAPRAMSRSFTVIEAAELLALLPEADPVGDTLPERARALVRQMSQLRSRRRSTAEDDVPDPIDQPLEAHQHAGELIAGALRPVLARIVELADDERPEAAAW
jgi:protein-tyrosine phosphatase